MKVPLQLGLRRLLLILATCAAWFAYWGNESQRSPVNANLIRTLRTTRSLPLQDTSKLTCQMTSFQGRSEWSLGTALNNMNAYQSFQCYAPHSGWEICISTRDFPAEGFPIASHVTPLNKGTSKIELSVSTTEKEYEINVLVEGTPAFVGREDKTWSKGGSVERKKESSRKQEQVDKPMLDSNCESMEIAHSGGNLVVLQSIDRGLRPDLKKTL